MRIGKLWDYEYPWDVRVEKVARALIDRGHEVHLMCRNRRGEPEHEHIDGLDIHRMPSWRRFGRWVDDVSSFPAFVNPRWIRHVHRVSRGAKVDLLLCRDLPLAPVALYVGGRLGIPVVLDMAENYPAMLKGMYVRSRFRMRNLLIRNPFLASAVERSVLRRLDAILVVVEESRDRLVNLGVDPERIEIVSNTPTSDRIQRIAPSSHAGSRGTGGPLRVVYLGLLAHSRGVVPVLEGIRILKDSEIPVHFDVIGEDPDGEHQAAVRRLGIDDRVTMHGHVPYDQALRIVADADVGIVPHRVTEHWSTTIPNKLFDYMAAGLPVVVSDAPPTRRIVEETGAGLVFRDADPEDLARVLRQLTDPALRTACGVAGRHAVLERYNWNRDAALLVDRLEDVFQATAEPVGPPQPA